MINAYPKVFAIGTDYIRDIFNDPVEVTEKIDGSQFAFGMINGTLFMRSKGAQLYVESHDKMFSAAISYIQQIQDRLPEGLVFYAEYLKAPKHNTLKYDRIPKNHIALYGVMHISQKFHPEIDEYADLFEIDTVPLLYSGRVNSLADVSALLEKESYLGGVKIEGFVVKNYYRKFLLGGQPMPLMAGKFVSEAFKEVHRDIEAEEEEQVKAFLWKEFSGELNRRATGGLAEWYKSRLAERSF